ncbi:MAG: hypothetical protein BKP49_00815 [Treponema sp. CETP13]|nr:MAG: hypothetical protein BKP49_00815 [Treponema sp. CETP13]
MNKTFKYIFIVGALFSCLSTLSAFEAHRVTPVDVSSLAMGGTHFADTTHFYTLYSNPAAIAFTEEKSLLASSSVNISGPITEFPELITNVFSTDFNDTEEISENIITPLLDLVGTSGLDMGFDSSFLTFGKIIDLDTFSFAIATMDNLYEDTSIDSLTSSSAIAGYDTGIEFAIALPVNLKIIPGTLSIGLSGRGTYQVESQSDDFISLATNLDLSELDYYTIAGIGIDAAIEHQIGFLTTAIVCQDAFSPVFITQYDNVDDLLAFNGTQLDTQTLDTKLGIGTEIKIPLKEKTHGIVNYCTIYADYKDFLPLFQDDSISRNPILELALGTEVKLIDIYTLKVGINESYLSTGIGIDLGKFTLNLAVYGSELGLEPGANPLLNSALSMTITY